MKLLFLVVIATLQVFAAAQTKFSETAWKEITPLYQRIVKHPFNQELMTGVLSKERFQYYSSQDSLYLIQFAKALTTLAEKLDELESMQRVLQFSVASLKEIKEVPALQMNKANFHYTNFLLATAAYKSREETAAAVLPCFWIYYALAKEMKKTAKAGSPYFDWIQSYSSEHYFKDVKDMVEITDNLAEKVSKVERGKMLAAFIKATEFELEFWDDAYHMAK